MIAICTPLHREIEVETAQCRAALVERHRMAARATALRELTFGASATSMMGPRVIDAATLEVQAAKYGAAVVELVGKPVDVARNELTAAALRSSDVTHLLWIDGDMVFPSNGLERLLSHKLPIVGGLYYGRLPPYFPIAMRNHAGSAGLVANSIGYVYDHPIDKLMQVDGTGGGFLLVAREVFEAQGMKAGEWWTPANKEGEDVAFCRRAMAAGYRIYVDTGLELGHIGRVTVTPKWARRVRTHTHNAWLPDTDIATAARTDAVEAAASVIVVATNAPAAALEATVKSVAAQTVPCELIVIDNGSEIPVSSIVGLPSWAVVHRLEVGRSMAAALNYALPLLTTDWLSVIAPGDIWQPARVERCLYAAATSENDAVVHNMDVTIGNGAAWMTPPIAGWKSRAEQLAAITTQPCVPLSSLFVRKHLAFDSMFNEGLQYAVPWRFVLDVAARVFLYQITDSLGVRRVRDEFKTAAEDFEARAMLAAFKTELADLILDADKPKSTENAK